MAELRSPSQTIGPFFHEALRWKDGGRVAGGRGRPVVLVGRVFDGSGSPVTDAMLETWQPPAAGSAAAPDGRPPGLGRVETGKDGSFRIETTLPEGPAPYLEVTLFARGLLKALRTRVYFAAESEVRADPAVETIAASPRLATLVAKPGHADEWTWEMRLQGGQETVFFTA
jgi:protocatechuate 3,4-dioxygenase alpha subunit